MGTVSGYSRFYGGRSANSRALKKNACLLRMLAVLFGCGGGLMVVESVRVQMDSYRASDKADAGLSEGR